MGLNETLDWSTPSYVTGLTSLTYLSALYWSADLYRVKRSRYYMALVGLIAMRMALLALTVTEQALHAFDVTLVSRFGTVLEWMCSLAHLALNAARLHGMCYHRTKRAVQILLGCAAVAVLVETADLVWTEIVPWAGNSKEDVTRGAEGLVLVWTLLDELVNSAMSLHFILFLRQLLVIPSGGPAGGELRGGMRDLIAKIQWFMGIEMVLVLAVTVTKLAAPDLDPTWSTLHLTEAIRVHVFCTSLSGLNRIMRRTTTAVSTGVSSSSDKHSSDMYGSSTANRTATLQGSKSVVMGGGGTMMPGTTTLITGSAAFALSRVGHDERAHKTVEYGVAAGPSSQADKQL
ncbi:hypothetical protein H9P43_004555 [Blastocladiella emersonii ATCC 22665]|nr:hypothetical protein H9P43_004555 [Blastocladiella emersonii ATCC 22665]